MEKRKVDEVDSTKIIDLSDCSDCCRIEFVECALLYLVIQFNITISVRVESVCGAVVPKNKYFSSH